eukprot:2416782-Rhodomonas_salina.1
MPRTPFPQSRTAEANARAHHAGSTTSAEIVGSCLWVRGGAGDARGAGGGPAGVQRRCPGPDRQGIMLTSTRPEPHMRPDPAGCATCVSSSATRRQLQKSTTSAHSAAGVATAAADKVCHDRNSPIPAPSALATLTPQR